MGAASEKGYAVATVADVVERASVSRRTFYEHFKDKQSCFLAAYDAGVAMLLKAMREAVRAVDGDDPRAWARGSIEAYLAILSGEPSFAWALHVEVFAAGPAAHARRAEIVSLLARQWRRLWERARRQDPSLPATPSDPLLCAIVVSHEELVRERLRAGDRETLHELTEPALAIALRILGAEIQSGRGPGDPGQR